MKREDNLFRAKEAAEYLRMSTSWLAKAVVYGNGPPYVKIGKSIRYRQSDLDAFIKKNVRKPK